MIEQAFRTNKHRAVRSFVLRTGRMTAAQSAAFEQNWPRWGREVRDGRFNAEEVFGRKAPLTFEIGFGMGDSLIEMALAMPERDFVGVEVHTPGVGRLLAKIEEHNLKNLRVYCDDAIEVLTHCFDDNSLDCVQVFFPDPWPKTKHHKRRLVQNSFLELLSLKLERGGLLHIATDWEAYAEHCVEVLAEQNWFQNTQADGDYCPRPLHRPSTKFERRGENLGHGVWDLVWRSI